METPEADAAVEQVRLELATRKLMVMLVGLIGVWVGIVIALTGAPNFIEDWFSPWSRYFLASPAFFAGLLTVAGGARSDLTRCGWVSQVAGLTGMALWYFAMAVVYFVLVLEQGFHVVGPGEPLADSVTGRGYVPLLYLGLTAMAVVPLATLVRLRGVLGRPSGRRDGPAAQA